MGKPLESGENANSPSSPEDDDSPSLDNILYLVSDHRRRAVLETVSTQQSVTVADLARLIAESEHEAGISAIRKGEIARLYLTLVHIHIPKLTNAGLIQYDEEQGIVRPTERLERVEPRLSLIDELKAQE